MDSMEQDLLDVVELAQKSVESAEKSQLNAGLALYDEDGNFVRHISLKRDPEPFREELKSAQERLDTYRNSLV